MQKKYNIIYRAIICSFMAAMILCCTKNNNTKKVTGKFLYNQACARCHGLSGQGGFAASSMKPISFTDPLMTNKLTDEAIKKAITYGRKGMPSFKAVFDDKQQNIIIAHIRTLQKNNPQKPLN